MVRLLKLCGQPAAVLTFENYASFNRYLREVNDGALVIYTGGFASIGIVEMLRSVLAMVEATMPFFSKPAIGPVMPKAEVFGNRQDASISY
jgi:hypothetical protein